MNNKVMPIALVLVLFISFGSIMREEILDVYKNMDTYYNYKKDCKIVKNYDIKHINLIEDQKVHDIIYKILLANSYIKQGTISNYMYNTKDEYKSEISGYLLKYKNINTKTFYIVNRLIYLNENLGNVNSQLKRSNEYKYLKYFVVSIILIMLLILIIIIHEYRKKNIKNEILNHKVEILNKQLNYQWKHYNDIKKHQDEVKRHWHDIKKHSTLILDLLENEEYQEAKDYIRSVTQEIKEVESKKISKNKIIDAILSNKIEECNSKNINLIMDIKIPETLNINDFDICVIFGNILDNAIEACENIDNS
uniref:sensor histidine kinase n=1 Tax=Faecalimicrobium dakarense TaxID=1301100 RepID=UPI0005AB5BFB